MTEGIQSIIYPVKDLAKAKTLYSELLGVEPYEPDRLREGCRREQHRSLPVGVRAQKIRRRVFIFSRTHRCSSTSGRSRPSA